MLTDVATVWPAAEDAVWNETLMEQLRYYRASCLLGMEARAVDGRARQHGVRVGRIGRRIDGRASRGENRHTSTSRMRFQSVIRKDIPETAAGASGSPR